MQGEAAGLPRVAAPFYESGPQRTKAAVVAFLRQQVAAGRLQIGDERLLYAAMQLLNNAVGMYQLQLWLGPRDSVDEVERGPRLERVVD